METLRLLIDLTIKGGIFMIPLGVVAVISVVLVVERFLFLRENRLNWDRFHFELKAALKDNDLERGIVLAARSKGIVGRVMQECLLRVQAGADDVESATEKEILAEMESMERSRGWLATMVQVAPLLGLIGTVQGMIQCFMTIEKSAATDPRLLAGGIYTALITTFAGLLIAIPISLAQEHLRKQTNEILHFLDLYLLEVQEWVERRGGKAPGASASAASGLAGEPASGLRAPAVEKTHG